MSGQRFTPGPWHLNGKQSIYGPNGECIAKSNWLNGEDGEANALLIAAAPDLLEALKSVISWMDSPSDSAFSDQQLSNARVAIAKALGE